MNFILKCEIFFNLTAISLALHPYLKGMKVCIFFIFYCMWHITRASYIYYIIQVSPSSLVPVTDAYYYGNLFVPHKRKQNSEI